jgi:hypothetical protein
LLEFAEKYFNDHEAGFGGGTTGSVGRSGTLRRSKTTEILSKADMLQYSK